MIDTPKSAIALMEVMAWIKNWDCAFLEDESGEWQLTEANVQEALKLDGVDDAQRKGAKTYVFDETVEATLADA